jgi:hypothetical protein
VSNITSISDTIFIGGKALSNISKLIVNQAIEGDLIASFQDNTNIPVMSITKAAMFVNTKIGIGTSVPRSNLDIVGDVNFTGNLTSNGAPFVSALPSWDRYTNTYVIINSNVGIGTIPTSTNRLDIAGTAGGASVCTVSNTGDIKTAGNITAFNSFSDRRLKDYIRSLDTQICVDKVTHLRPVEFIWNSNATLKSAIGKRDIGVIAQELEKIIPEAVSTQEIFEYGEIKSVKYERIIPILIGALQNAMKRIDDLELIVKHESLCH